ncbi:hypothetical protein AT6N2_C0152 [Agrobacterium tumefaciens]|nr:hypothetical protein AT6N2_C0152 [Agrobacterium tumefaciens]
MRAVFSSANYLTYLEINLESRSSRFCFGAVSAPVYGSKSPFAKAESISAEFKGPTPSAPQRIRADIVPDSPFPFCTHFFIASPSLCD